MCGPQKILSKKRKGNKMAFQITPEGKKKFEEVKTLIARVGVDPEMLNEAIARTLEALNQDDEALSQARWLEKVRSLQFLIQTQRLVSDKPTSIVGHKDLSELSEDELDKALKAARDEVARLEAKQEKVLQ